MRPSDIYRPPLALLTDFYELTMAQAYFERGMAETRATFNLFFRRHPFGSGFTLAAGLEAAADLVQFLHFNGDDLSFLAGQCDRDGEPMFSAAFLNYLGAMRPALDIDAVPEGTVVFPQEPLIRVRGPLAQAQLVETALLNQVNYATLVATKAAAVVAAAGGAPVLEFGLRRAQGIDGGLTASWSAYLGGCAATSNTLAGRMFGIPVRGTHAHSWVLSFADEQEAFAAYAEAMPSNTTLLVDTYDTITGVGHAIETAKRMRARGQTFTGIRLDSGNLAWLSKAARAMLDEAGFPEAVITASNDLDPETIISLRQQGARIDVWGVGTKLVTCYNQPALGGVYKLVAIDDGPGGATRTPVKVSDEPVKVSVPGVLGVRRFYDTSGVARADMIYDENDPGAADEIIDPETDLRREAIDPSWTARELLVPVFRKGIRVYDSPSLDESRTHAAADLATFDETVRRRLKPHRYPAGLEAGLYARRAALVSEAMRRERGGKPKEA